MQSPVRVTAGTLLVGLGVVVSSTFGAAMYIEGKVGAVRDELGEVKTDLAALTGRFDEHSHAGPGAPARPAPEVAKTLAEQEKEREDLEQPDEGTDNAESEETDAAESEQADKLQREIDRLRSQLARRVAEGKQQTETLEAQIRKAEEDLAAERSRRSNAERQLEEARKAAEKQRVEVPSPRPNATARPSATPGPPSRPDPEALVDEIRGMGTIDSPVE
jgi:chromosome segregation ATPase